MQNLFVDYPESAFRQGWLFSAAPEPGGEFVTAQAAGAVTQPGAGWTLECIEPEAPFSTLLLYNGFSILARKRPMQNHVFALVTAPGILRGIASGLPPPRLTAGSGIRREETITLHQNGAALALLAVQGGDFCLVTGALSRDQALALAGQALQEPFDTLIERETARRQKTAALFGPNPRHNPPVALAAEALMRRLRRPAGALAGTWSEAEGFGPPTFSLNELYPLVQAWLLMDPPTAVDLIKTALSLQQAAGGFPAWIEPGGRSASVAPWPLLAQTCEMVLHSCPDPELLKQMLPALRKYLPWALRHFDPHRDRLPAWQSAQEDFVPDRFERGKATPELTVMLIREIESFTRLCEEGGQPETAESSVRSDYDQLTQSLTATFWNPDTRDFTNVWKNGYPVREPAFGAFLPIWWDGLDPAYKTSVLQKFEDTHAFPGQQPDAGGWKHEEMEDTRHLPAIHQFMALEALRAADANRSLLSLYVRRSRDVFAAWFEQESIAAARLTDHNQPAEAPAFAVGPVTAALILNVQQEFQRGARDAATFLQRLRALAHQLRIDAGEIRIVAVFLLAVVFVHLFYQDHRSDDPVPRLAEAVHYYQQGRFTDALEICRLFPREPLARLLQGNLMMLAEQPVEAEKFYRAALMQETGSPSALFGLALSLHMSGRLDEAVKRYGDFIDIHSPLHPEAAALADEFRALAAEAFLKPPKWRRIYGMPMMNDLGL